MKNKISFIIALVLMFGVNANAQELSKSLGIGIGTKGLTVKNHNESAFGFISRLGLGSGYSLESYDISLNSSVFGVINVVNTIDYRMYFGFGVDFFYRQNFRSNDDVLNVNLIFTSPIGIELFPFDNKRLSFTVESNIAFARTATFADRIGGLFEFTYYFNK